ncbi:hypothetical protein [Acidimangrovimonas sediminis]|uniref:hypothetical protein n=1 Tax=Acidimangrovimonas sediminis TaxID=2056283 RepID=UPI000C7FDBEC|nr:hypothetical protein [Acidimangrovimonas sediminis]
MITPVEMMRAGVAVWARTAQAQMAFGFQMSCLLWGADLCDGTARDGAPAEAVPEPEAATGDATVVGARILEFTPAAVSVPRRKQAALSPPAAQARERARARDARPGVS